MFTYIHTALYFTECNHIPRTISRVVTMHAGSISRDNGNKYGDHLCAIIASRSASLSKLYGLNPRARVSNGASTMLNCSHELFTRRPPSAPTAPQGNPASEGGRGRERVGRKKMERKRERERTGGGC